MSSLSKNFAALFLLFSIAFAANWTSIADYKTLSVEDLSRYDQATRNEIVADIAKRNFLRAYVMQVGYELLTVDMRLARSYIVFFMAIVSWLTYLLLRNLGFEWSTSLFGGSISSIIIEQDTIPYFIDGSYYVPGSAAVLLSMVLALKYLNSHRVYFFVLSSVAYMASMELMDNSIFLMPPFLLLLFFHKQQNVKLSRQKISMMSAVFLIATLKGAKQYFFPVNGYMTLEEIPMSQVIFRIERSIHQIFPLMRESVDGVMLNPNIILLAWLVLSGVLFVRMFWLNKNDDIKFIVGLAVVAIVWVCASSFIFWARSPYFSARYFYVPSIAVGFLVALCFGRSIKDKRSNGSLKYISYALFCVWLVQVIHVKDAKSQIRVGRANSHHEFVESALDSVEFPPNSQVAIFGNTAVPTASFWKYSTIYLKIATGRNDLSGFIGNKKFQFYNPFNPEQRTFATQMTGLDESSPIFIFRMKGGGEYEQLKYALIWHASKWTKGMPGAVDLGAASQNDLRASRWRILEFDAKTGASRLFHEGHGIQQYRKFILEQASEGLSESEIAWAGPMNAKTLTRFGDLQN